MLGVTGGYYKRLLSLNKIRPCPIFWAMYEVFLEFCLVFRGLAQFEAIGAWLNILAHQRVFELVGLTVCVLVAVFVLSCVCWHNDRNGETHHWNTVGGQRRRVLQVSHGSA